MKDERMNELAQFGALLKDYGEFFEMLPELNCGDKEKVIGFMLGLIAAREQHPA